MPWKITKRGDIYKVVNKRTGKVRGRHHTREQAMKQLSALYANYHDKFDRRRYDGSR